MKPISDEYAEQLRRDGSPEWVIAELQDPHEAVRYMPDQFGYPFSRRRQAHTAAVACIVLNAIDDDQVAPFYSTIIKALNDAEVPRAQKPTDKPWNEKAVQHLLHSTETRDYVVQSRHTSALVIEALLENKNIHHFEV